MFRVAPKDKPSTAAPPQDPQAGMVPPGPAPGGQAPPEAGGGGLPPELMAMIQQGQGQGQGDPGTDGGDPNDQGEGETSPGSVDQSIVVYMTKEYGPFQCSNCVHFLQPNACHIVSGEIDPEGICHVFTPASGGDDQQAPQDQATPPEAPPEGAPEPPPSQEPPQEGEGY